MREQLKDPLTTRTVVISFPDGETQYWLTDLVFSPGETLRRNGRVWLVDDVLEPARSGGYLKVRLREPNGRSRTRPAY